jgi:ribosomal protein S1
MDKKEPDMRSGKIVTGTVVQVGRDVILLDVGSKTEAALPVSELGNQKVKEGEHLKVVISQSKDITRPPRVSYAEARRRHAVEEIQDAFRSSKEVVVHATRPTRGGLLVEFNGIRGFMPASHISTTPVKNLRNYVPGDYAVKILKFDQSKDSLIVSARQVLEESLIELWKEVPEKYPVGSVVEGEVTGFTKFGAFVRLENGVEGMIHITDLSWKDNVKLPSQCLKKGQRIAVKVMKVDANERRIALSYRHTQSNPYAKFRTGQTITARVRRTTPTHILVELEPGVKGVIHISQISLDRVNKPSDVVKPGQPVQAKVIRCVPERQLLELSMKEYMKDKEVTEIKKYLPRENAGATIGDILRSRGEGK